jgi:hypothetical protein
LLCAMRVDTGVVGSFYQLVVADACIWKLIVVASAHTPRASPVQQVTRIILILPTATDSWLDDFLLLAHD